MKDFLKKHKIKKSFRVVIFFICIICLSFGGYTVCKLLFDGNSGSYWNGSVATSFASGEGTQANPYIINTPSQFAYLQTGCKNNVYIRLNSDIYLNEGYIEKEEDNYYLYIREDKYSLDVNTGVATKGVFTKSLTKYSSTTDATSCHIDGNNHKVYGLYIQSETDASFLHNFTGTINNLHFQSSLVSGVTATLIKKTANSTYNDIYFDGHLVSSGVAPTQESTNPTLFNQLLMDATGEATPEAAMTEIAAKGDPNYSTYSQYSDEGMYKTLDDDGDTYYYRGKIDYNHVLFGGFCWRIVRTTGTGGVKLIYDGIPNNGTCNNTGDATEIGKSQFNDSTDHSIAYAGYMYGEARPTNVFYVEKSPTNVKFSRSASYSTSTKKYSLNTSWLFEMIPTNWGNKFDSSVNAGQVYTKHYTCLNDQTSCNPMYYVTTITSTTSTIDPLEDYPAYYQTLSNGETIANLLDTMVTSSSNTTSSTAKEEIDAWFEENLLEYESYLEDTIYCNNREVIQKGAWTETATNHDAKLTFGGYQRNYSHVNRSLLCPSQNDKFTVSSSRGNGELTYPVGLLTLDEMTYAGHKYSTSSGGDTKNYLYTQSPFWTMTPFFDNSSYDNVNIGVASSTVTSSYTNESNGLRPVISLKANTKVASGNGTAESPYQIEETSNKLHDKVVSSSIASSDTIDFTVSSEYAEANYTTSTSYAHEAGVYQLAEDPSIYFYRGSVTNNNVLFANHCWKIVRTTNTGGTKLIYAGVPSNGTCSNKIGASVSIGTSAYNESNHITDYVKYTTDVFASGHESDSTIKEYIDTWYEDNLISYADYIEDTVYCNNAVELSIVPEGVNSLDRVSNYYQAYSRGSWYGSIATPSLVCPSNESKYTVSSSIGNGYLKYPIGLITTDEVTLAGRTSAQYNGYNNSTYYLNNNNGALSSENTYWTMSPFVMQFDIAKVDIVGPVTTNDAFTVSYPRHVRPVISLDNNVIITGGNGNSNTPYTVGISTDSQDSNGYSSLIGTSSNSTYSIIKLEGSIDSKYKGASLINLSTSDNINNIQVNMDANVKYFAPFVSDGTSTIYTVYYKGNIEAESANLFMSNNYLNENVYVLGTINNNANVNANCEEVYCIGYNYQNLVDSYTYLPESTIAARLNSTVVLMFWKTQGSKLPELMVSGDGGNPVFYATVSTTTETDQVRENTTVNINDTKWVLHSKSSPQINVNTVEDTTVVKKVQYYIGNCHPLTEAELNANEDIEWIDYSSTITLTERGSYIVYFKVTDINNNVGYFTTHYIIYDQLNATYYNGDTGISLLGNSIGKDTILEVDYKTLGSNQLSNFPELSSYKIDINSLPIGTVIYFKVLRPGNYYQNYIYSYTITGEEGEYVDLKDFRLTGVANHPTYDDSTLNLKNKLTLYYNFTNTSGGTFDANLVIKDNTNIYLESSVSNSINIINQTDAITLANNQTTTLALNSIGTQNIRYTATSSNTSGYYYLKFNVLNSNNNIMDASLMKGLSIIYNDVEYFPNNGGTIVIPLGTFTSTINITLKTNYLVSRLIPGTYFIGAQLYNERASSSYSKFSISTNYTNDGRLKNLIEIERANNDIVNPGDDFRFIINSNIGLLPEYASANLYPYMELYKKDFTLGNYNAVNINDYVSGSFTPSVGNEVFCGSANTTYVSIPWSSALTPGAYRLDVRIKLNDIAKVKEESLYFVVTGD